MKFNSKKESTAILNHEGAKAYRPQKKVELYMRVLSTFMGEKSFYVSGKQLTDELRELIHQNDPEYVLKLAHYARHKMHLRSVPIVLMGEYALEMEKFPGAWKYIAATISRPDEITELCSYVMEQNKMRKCYTGKLPHVIKRAVAEAFSKFDEYQLAKYNRDAKVTLKDAMFLTHPRRTELTDKLANDTLATPETWETYISKHGSSRKTWEKIMPKMPYMATLRNLRNFEKHGCDLSGAINLIVNPDVIRKNKQLPFRYYSAYREVMDTELFDALEDAIEISVDNISKFEGTSVTLCDVSGSMSQNISSKSSITCNDIACLFSSIVHKLNPKTKVFAFAQKFEQIGLSSRNGIINNMEKIQRADVGYATYAGQVIQHMIENKIVTDRIFMFSDMQVYGMHDFNSNFAEYKRTINPNVILYSFDLAGHGQLAVPANNTVVISGWSERIFDFISKYENGAETMLKEIESIIIR